MARVSVTIPWKPHAKQRPRSARGHTYTPAPTKKAEAAILAALKERLPDHEAFDCPLGVDIAFFDDHFQLVVWPVDDYKNRRLRGDTDNYLKTVLDAANGFLWDDDKQIVDLRGVKV